MYKIIISNSAEKDMDKLPKFALKKVEEAIDRLAEVPHPRGCKKLQGTNENLWRVRTGDYRIVYLIAEKIEIIDIRSVSHRQAGYK